MANSAKTGGAVARHEKGKGGQGRKRHVVRTIAGGPWDKKDRKEDLVPCTAGGHSGRCKIAEYRGEKKQKPDEKGGRE